MKEYLGPPFMPQSHQTAGCASHAPLPHHAQTAVQAVRSLGITGDYRGALLGSPMERGGQPMSNALEAGLALSASAWLHPAHGRRRDQGVPVSGRPLPPLPLG